MGNHFKIILRNVRESPTSSNDITSVIPHAMEGVKEAGFINYFGQQRFGSSVGLLVGLAILKRNYVSLARVL